MKTNMQKINFGRGICGHLDSAQSREWLVTNGIGGYASGTVGNLLTRRYHGLLIAALQPPLGRTLLVTKLDETVIYAGLETPLFTNRWSGNVVDPAGFQHIEQFYLDSAIPVWRFAVADSLLEKRIWMRPGKNTTYVRYHLLRASAPMVLTSKALVNFRDHHASTNGDNWAMQVAPVQNGLRVAAFPDSVPFYILSKEAEMHPAHIWIQNFELSVEQYRGLQDREDHLYAADIRTTLEAGQSVTIVFSTTENPGLDGEAALNERKRYETDLVQRAPGLPETLTLAADQFIVSRSSDVDPGGQTILAGYPWFGDWGRDTMISLPGLTLATGRPQTARSILKTFSHYLDQGMLPNRFPDGDQTPEYNTVDATLWYFEALHAYHATTRDDTLLEELYPKLEEIIDWHLRGTRYHIHADLADGLLCAGEPGVQLTWMDAKVEDWVVTPRTGKPVEINALWYNALRIMAGFARHIGKSSTRHEKLAEQIKDSFQRFWNEGENCLFDVLDTPWGADPSVRPNQLFAVSLTYSPLPEHQQKAVVDTCARYLLTSYGLRSLSPEDTAYIGRYGGTVLQRDGAYHEGTVWGWLIGPFISAYLKVYHDTRQARAFLQPLLTHLTEHGLGTISEIFDGDPPHTPRGCFAQAWSVAEMIRVWDQIEKAENGFLNFR